MNPSVCKSCGASLSGKFCSQCGEKVYTDHDKRIAHFFEEGLHFITHFDGKFFTTLKTIVLHTGQLSLDYCNGIRKKYFKPLSLFLVIVVLYLLFPKFQGLNMKLGTYANNYYSYSVYALPVIQSKLTSHHISFEQLAEHYNHLSEKVAKFFLIMLIPLSAMALWLLFLNRKKLFFDHFVLAIEICTLLIAFKFLIIPFADTIITAIYAPGERFFQDDSIPLFIVENTVMFLIIAKATKKFYAQNWWWTLSKSVLFLLLYSFIIVGIYKALLFYFIMLFL